MKLNIRLLYLYLFSFVGLLIVVIGSVNLVDLGIKSVFFKEADVYSYPRPKMVCLEGEACEDQTSEEEYIENARLEAQKSRQRQLSNSTAMILVGAPLYLYHWKIINKDKK